MARYGIDVSAFQGTIDWVKVKAAGCAFAVVKAIRKDFTPDKQFYNNVKGCRAQAIPFDVYTYVYESTVAGARKRAAAVIEALETAGVKSTCVWWDMEDSTISSYNSSTKKYDVSKKAALKESIKAAQAVIEGAGYKFGVYCNTNWYNNVLDVSGLSCPFWIASYGQNPATPFGTGPNRTAPKITHELCGWQYCSKGKIQGISGNVDMNIAYCHFGTDATNDGSTGTKATTTTTTNGGFNMATLSTMKKGSEGAQVKSLQVLLNGKNGAGLTVDGTCGPVTVAAIKAYQKKHGLTQDGVCGPKTWAEILTK